MKLSQQERCLRLKGLCFPPRVSAVATGRSWCRSTPPGRSPAAVLCDASKKKSPKDSNASGAEAAGLAKSFLRDAMNALSTPAGSAPTQRAGVATAATLPEDLRSASYAIAATQTALFLACALLPLLPAAAMLLNHRQPQLWQLLTSSFTHPSFESLMQCVFFTYIFGRVVERNHGSLATWLVYIACGAAAAGMAWWMLPAKGALLSSAAPAAAWGLFLVGIGLPRVAKKPLEVACLLPFAFAATMSRYSPLASLLVHEGMAQGQLVHVVGASLAAGVAALVLAAVDAWREEQERKRREAERKQMEAKRKEAAANQEEVIVQVINAASQAAAQLGKKLL